MGLCFGELYDASCSFHIWKDSRVSPLVVNPPKEDSKCGQNRAAFPSSSGPLSLASAFSAVFPSSHPSHPPSSSSFHLVLITTLSSTSSIQSSWSFLSRPSSLPTSSSPPSHHSTPVPKMLHRASLVLRLAGSGARKPWLLRD